MNKVSMGVATRLLFVAPILVLAACAGSGQHSVPIAGGSDASLRIALSGDISRPSTLTGAELAKLPPSTQTVSYMTGSGSQTRTYTGAGLWSVIDRAGIKTDPARKGDLQTKYVVASAADGYRVLFSIGELKPDLGGRTSLIAYAETRNGLSAPTSKLTSPGDVKGGRYVSVPTGLDVRASGSTKAGTGGGFSTSFTVSGAVQKPFSLDLAALRAMPAVTRQVGKQKYTGVDLWYLLNTVAGIQAPASAKDPSLVRYVVATGSDGYQALISLGELDPGFGAEPDLVAYAVDGVPLDRSGFARLVVPRDERAGRTVSNLIDLEVFVAPAPP